MKTTLSILLFVTTLTIHAQNPRFIKDVIRGGNANTKVGQIVSTTNGKTFFNVMENSDPFNDHWDLWVTDGTTNGTQQLQLKTSRFITTKANLITPLGTNKIAFAGDNFLGYGEVWISDGTQSGTEGIENYVPGGNNAPVMDMAPLDNAVVYGVLNTDEHLQLRRLDSTSDSTTILLYDFGEKPNSLLKSFKTVNNIIYFDFYNEDEGGEDIIWRSDGTTAGTYPVINLHGDALASYFMNAGNLIYFITASNFSNGMYIWKTDGTEAGTSPLQKITGYNVDVNKYPPNAAVGDTLYFSADNGVNGRELWRTDGTTPGTYMAADILTGPGSSEPAWLCAYNHSVFFSARNAGNDLELYQFDGTLVSEVKDINPGTNSSFPYNITGTKNGVVFAAMGSNSDGFELWTSDGTPGNTVEVENINPTAFEGSSPDHLTSGNQVYFSGTLDINGDGLPETCIFLYNTPDKIWSGNNSSNTADANNWFPTGTPGAYDNVIIPYNPANTIQNPFIVCNDFINNGSSIEMGGGLLIAGGNFYNAGTINNQNNGILAIVQDQNDTTIKELGLPGTLIGQLTFSGGAQYRLTSDATIPIIRSEGPDRLYLGPYHLHSNGFSLNLGMRIITDSTGSFSMPVSNSPVLFPVAADSVSYSPVTITNSGIADNFNVRAMNGICTEGFTGNPITQEAVNKTWDIGEDHPGNANATIKLEWNGDQELPLFNRNHVYLSHFTNGSWDNGIAAPVSGSNPFSITRSCITSFSPFAVTSSPTALPEPILSFTALPNDKDVLLHWQTSDEKNVIYYNILRSTNGRDFTAIAQQPAIVYNNLRHTYSYTDVNIASLHSPKVWYRLQIVSADRSTTYSNITMLDITTGSIPLIIYPNPVHSILHLSVADIQGNTSIKIIDLSGKQLYAEQLNITATPLNKDVNVSNLSPGLYIVEVITGKGTNKSKFLKN